LSTNVTELPDGYEDLLTRPLIGHLATVRPDGNPAVTPMWFSWDGELLRFTHTTRRAKLRNIEHNPHVALSVADPDQPYRYLQARAQWRASNPIPLARSTSSWRLGTAASSRLHRRIHPIAWSSSCVPSPIRSSNRRSPQSPHIRP
jgi:PPOX class probable F420-dependent enzyme